MKMKKVLASTIVAAMLAAGAITASAANTSYSDVSSGAWYAPAVNIVTSHGLMNGIGNNQFAPNDSVSRAMIVQILYNQAGKPNVGGNAVFSDVKQGAWYYNAVQWAAQNKVASGVGDGKFAPDAKVTRQDFAVFLYRNSGSPSVSGSLNFSDANQVSSWAKNALLWANQNGIVNGARNGNQLLLNPTGNAARAEAAQMLSNYLDISKPGHSYGDGKVTKAATCTNSGEKRYTCSICGKTKTEAIPATGHKVVTDKGIAPTCTVMGKEEGTHCSVCYTVFKPQDPIPPLGHNYKATVTKEATCSTAGVKTYTCSRCGYSYTETIPATGKHEYTSEVTKEATCGTTGLKTNTCTVCGHTKEETIPATGNHDYNDEVVKAASCDEDGEIKRTCQTCGRVSTEAIPKLGHEWEAQYEDVWVVDKDAYDEEVITGYRPYYMCTGCKERFYFDQYEPTQIEIDEGYPYPGGVNASHAVDDHLFVCSVSPASSTQLVDTIWETIHHDEVGHYEKQIAGYACTRCDAAKGID